VDVIGRLAAVDAHGSANMSGLAVAIAATARVAQGMLHK
jgi:hypothetical protein